MPLHAKCLPTKSSCDGDVRLDSPRQEHVLWHLRSSYWLMMHSPGRMPERDDWWIWHDLHQSRHPYCSRCHTQCTLDTVNVITKHKTISHTWSNDLESILSKSRSMFLNGLTCFDVGEHFSQIFVTLIAMRTILFPLAIKISQIAHTQKSWNHLYRLRRGKRQQFPLEWNEEASLHHDIESKNIYFLIPAQLETHL